MGWPYQQKPPLGWPLDYDSGLVPEAGFWLMNEGSGNKVFDLSGNGNTGILDADAVWRGGGIHVANGDYLASIPHSPTIDGIGGLSVVFYVDIEGLTNFDTIITKNTNTSWNDGYGLIWMDNSFRFFAGVYTTYASKAHTATGKFLLVGTWDGTTARIYIDGVEGSSNTGTNPNNTAIAILGAYETDASAAGTLVGTYYYGMIYNRALSASEIALLYQYPFWMFKDPAELILASAGQVAVGANPKGPLGHPLHGALAGPISF